MIGALGNKIKWKIRRFLEGLWENYGFSGKGRRGVGESIMKKEVFVGFGGGKVGFQGV